METYLKKILTERGISYGMLAKVTGLSKTCVYYYVNGLRKPDIDSALKIFNALRLDYSELGKLFDRP